MERLYVRADSMFVEATDESIIENARAVVSKRFRRGSAPLLNPDDTTAFLTAHLGTLDYEVFGILHLDTGHRLIVAENMFRGTMNCAIVNVREVAQSVLKHRSTAVILFHNHPSGPNTPSPADIALTKKIGLALDLLDVKILDHLIVGESVFSFSKAGIFVNRGR